MSGVLSTGIYDQNLNLLMSFDTYVQNNFHNTNNVAYEPLENGTFSSDSKQNSPFLVSITGVKVINSNTNNPTISVDQLNQRLVILLQSTQLVTVVLQPMIAQANQSTSKFAQIFQHKIPWKNIRHFCCQSRKDVRIFWFIYIFMLQLIL